MENTTIVMQRYKGGLRFLTANDSKRLSRASKLWERDKGLILSVRQVRCDRDVLTKTLRPSITGESGCLDLLPAISLSVLPGAEILVDYDFESVLGRPPRNRNTPPSPYIEAGQLLKSFGLAAKGHHGGYSPTTWSIGGKSERFRLGLRVVSFSKGKPLTLTRRNLKKSSVITLSQHLDIRISSFPASSFHKKRKRKRKKKTPVNTRTTDRSHQHLRRDGCE